MYMLYRKDALNNHLYNLYVLHIKSSSITEAAILYQNLYETGRNILKNTANISTSFLIIA